MATASLLLCLLAVPLAQGQWSNGTRYRFVPGTDNKVVKLDGYPFACDPLQSVPEEQCTDSECKRFSSWKSIPSGTPGKHFFAWQDDVDFGSITSFVTKFSDQHLLMYCTGGASFEAGACPDSCFVPNNGDEWVKTMDESCYSNLRCASAAAFWEDASDDDQFAPFFSAAGSHPMVV